MSGTTEPRPLEELVREGEVQAALLLRGAFTRREMELVKRAWDAGIEMGMKIQRNKDEGGAG